MELRQLKSLCLIAQHGTVREAAERSFLTSSAVSLQIKTLERELGVQLSKHAGKRLVLTPKVEALYQDVQRILESVRDAFEKDGRGNRRVHRQDIDGRAGLFEKLYLSAIALSRHLSGDSPHDFSAQP